MLDPQIHQTIVGDQCLIPRFTRLQFSKSPMCNILRSATHILKSSKLQTELHFILRIPCLYLFSMLKQIFILSSAYPVFVSHLIFFTTVCFYFIFLIFFLIFAIYFLSLSFLNLLLSIYLSIYSLHTLLYLSIYLFSGTVPFFLPFTNLCHIPHHPPLLINPTSQTLYTTWRRRDISSQDCNDRRAPGAQRIGFFPKP